MALSFYLKFRIKSNPQYIDNIIIKNPNELTKEMVDYAFSNGYDIEKASLASIHSYFDNYQSNIMQPILRAYLYSGRLNVRTLVSLYENKKTTEYEDGLIARVLLDKGYRLDTMGQDAKEFMEIYDTQQLCKNVILLKEALKANPKFLSEIPEIFFANFSFADKKEIIDIVIGTIDIAKIFLICNDEKTKEYCLKSGLNQDFNKTIHLISELTISQYGGSEEIRRYIQLAKDAFYQDIDKNIIYLSDYAMCIEYSVSDEIQANRILEAVIRHKVPLDEHSYAFLRRNSIVQYNTLMQMTDFRKISVSIQGGIF